MAYHSKQFISICALLFIFVNEVSCACTTGSDEVSFTCKESFAGQSISLKVEVETCREKQKINVKIDIDALSIHLDESFDNSQTIPIPGFSYVFAGVDLKVELNSDTDGYTTLKLSLVPNIIVDITSLTVLNKKIAKSDCNEFLYWWNSSVTGVKIGVAGGGAVVVILLFICCIYCCCCYCRKERRNNGGQSIIVPPSQPSNNTMMINNTQMQSLPQPYMINNTQMQSLPPPHMINNMQMQSLPQPYPASYPLNYQYVK